jgi:hypothetical protein
MTIDRSAVAQALAKAIAYKNVGNDAAASRWAAILIEHLECSEIIRPDFRAPSSIMAERT